MLKIKLVGTLEVVLRLLKVDPELARFRSITNTTALFMAAWNNACRMAAALLDLGVSVDAKSVANQTALMYAAILGLAEMAELLLKRGADTAERDKEDLTALQEAEKSDNVNKRAGAVAAAIRAHVARKAEL